MIVGIMSSQVVGGKIEELTKIQTGCLAKNIIVRFYKFMLSLS